MSDFHNEKLRKLAQRSNADMLKPIDSFVQGFIMGRKYERENNAQLHNRILKEINETSIPFSEDNFWDKLISEQESELFSLKSKYVWGKENE